MPAWTPYFALACGGHLALAARSTRIEALVADRFRRQCQEGVRVSTVAQPAVAVGPSLPLGLAPGVSRPRRLSFATVLFSVILAVAILPVGFLDAVLAADPSAAPVTTSDTVLPIPVPSSVTQPQVGPPATFPGRHRPIRSSPHKPIGTKGCLWYAPWVPRMSPDLGKAAAADPSAGLGR